MVKKYLFLLGLVLFLSTLGFWWGRRTAPLVSYSEKQLEEFSQPLAKVALDRLVSFPTGEEEDIFGLRVIETQKVKLVSTQNQPVQAKANESFLIFSLEYQNDHDYPIKVDSQNYLRLLDQEGKKYAPDFFNGPLTVLAESVKKDEVGFLVDSQQNEFLLQVGQIGDEEKTEIEIRL